MTPGSQHPIHGKQVPGNPHPDTAYIIYEGEIEALEMINEQLPSDEIEMESRQMFARIRDRRPHTSARSEQEIRLNCQPLECTCEDCQRFRKPECPFPESNITMDKCHSFLIDIRSHDKKIRADEREKVLIELGTLLNHNISKMEILDSNNPSPLRKGIIMAYRDIENWQRRQPPGDTHEK